MADALVTGLNALGYQPVFMPKTNVKPAEVYTFTRPHLRRWGPLADFFKGKAKSNVLAIQPETGALADLALKHTSRKGLSSAVQFLESAMHCLGISQPPKLDLSFTGAADHIFAFSGVTTKSIDPSKLKSLLTGLDTSGLPQDYVAGGRVHIVYEYAYARRLLLRRLDKKEFTQSLKGGLSGFLELGIAGKVELADETTVSFSEANGSPQPSPVKLPGSNKLRRVGSYTPKSP